MYRRSNRTLIVALSLSVILAASHADAAPTEEEDDLIVPQKQFAPALTIPAEAKVIEGTLQPQLVATHEIAIGYNPAPGLVQRTFQLRPRIQNKSKGGLAEMTTPTIVWYHPGPKTPAHDRFEHTPTSDPFVDIHS